VTGSNLFTLHARARAAADLRRVAAPRDLARRGLVAACRRRRGADADVRCLHRRVRQGVSVGVNRTHAIGSYWNSASRFRASLVWMTCQSRRRIGGWRCIPRDRTCRGEACPRLSSKGQLSPTVNARPAWVSVPATYSSQMANTSTLDNEYATPPPVRQLLSRISRSCCSKRSAVLASPGNTKSAGGTEPSRRPPWVRCHMASPRTESLGVNTNAASDVRLLRLFGMSKIFSTTAYEYCASTARRGVISSRRRPTATANRTSRSRRPTADSPR